MKVVSKTAGQQDRRVNKAVVAAVLIRQQMSHKDQLLKYYGSATEVAKAFAKQRYATVTALACY